MGRSILYQLRVLWATKEEARQLIYALAKRQAQEIQRLRRNLRRKRNQTRRDNRVKAEIAEEHGGNLE